jgi:hypothetical protein
MEEKKFNINCQLPLQKSIYIYIYIDIGKQNNGKKSCSNLYYLYYKKKHTTKHNTNLKDLLNLYKYKYFSYSYFSKIC